MTVTENRQLVNGIITQTNFLNTYHKVITINKNTPIPNTKISFLINDIISSAIIGIPPRYILASFL